MSNAAYHLGRLLSYATLGAFAGAVGGSLDYWGTLAGVHRATALITGALLIFWGSALLLRRGGAQNGIPSGWTAQLFAKLFGGIRNAGISSEQRSFGIGLLTGMLPCGWLYMFVLVAASSGSVLRGAATMAVFWLGSVPLLAGVGGLSAWLTPRFSRFIPRVTALLLILAGFFSLFSHTALLFDPAQKDMTMSDHMHH